MRKINIFFFILVLIPVLYIASREKQEETSKTFLPHISSKENAPTPEVKTKESLPFTPFTPNEKTELKEETSTSEQETQNKKELFSKKPEEEYFEGISQELLDNYKRLTIGTRLEHHPAFAFTLKYAKLKEEQMEQVMILCQEYETALRKIRAEESTTNNEESTIQVNEKKYEKKILNLLTLEQRKLLAEGIVSELSELLLKSPKTK